MAPALPVLQVPDGGVLHVRRTYLRWMVTAVLLAACGGAAQGEWIDQSPPDIPALRVVHAVNTQVAWAAGIDGTIVRTVDGGQTWEDRSIPNDASYRWALYAFDDQKCITGSHWGVVHMTTDGGDTWQPVHNTTTFINGIHFFDEQRGVLHADARPSTQRFVICHTEDGGYTWTYDENAPAADPDSVAGIDGSYCWTDDQNGIFGTTDFIAWRTTDGGASWDSVTTNTQYVQALVVSETGGIGLAAGDVGKLDRSTDGGASWDSVTSPTPELGIRNFDWVEGTDRVWGVTFRGGGGSVQSRILNSTNAGLDWTIDIVSSEFNAFDISAASDSVVWAVGGDGTIGVARIFKLQPVVAVGDDALADAFSPHAVLHAVNPNPFQTQTVLHYTLPSAAPVRLSIYGPQGRRVATLVDRVQAAGPHLATWDGLNGAGERVASGTYFCHIRAGRLQEVRRVVFTR